MSEEMVTILETAVGDMATNFLEVGAVGIGIAAGIYALVTGWRFIRTLI